MFTARLLGATLFRLFLGIGGRHLANKMDEFWERCVDHWRSKRAFQLLYKLLRFETRAHHTETENDCGRKSKQNLALFTSL